MTEKGIREIRMDLEMKQMEKGTRKDRQGKDEQGYKRNDMSERERNVMRYRGRIGQTVR